MLNLAKERLIIVMPSIHEEWIEVIKENPFIKDISVNICIDNSEEVIRNGYGSCKSVIELRNLGINILECPGLRVSFVSADSESYFLFLESRILSGDPFGYNAIQVNEEQVNILISEIFGEKESAFPHNKKLKEISELKYDVFEQINNSIKVNPPDSPDLKRKINTYNTKFQYAELHFEGGNIANKTITIPSKALPFKDVEMTKRMRATLKLFEESVVEKWSEVAEIRAEIASIRKSYLTSCSIRKDKSILKKENKKAFQDAVENIKVVAESKIKLLKNKIQHELNNAEDILTKELAAFFENNPTEDFKKSLDNLDLDARERRIKKMVNDIIYKVKLPDAESLISKIKIEALYFEFTWEDLNDPEFMEWFETKGLIDENVKESLANYNPAFVIKR